MTRTLADNTILVGIDGGATEVKAHHVTFADRGGSMAFELAPASAARTYERLPDFQPVAITDQLRQRDTGTVTLTDGEVAQARTWINAAVDAVAELAEQCDAGNRPLLVGMGMPGLKTPDGRGINALNNGPRLPEFLDLVERRLADRGIRLAAPVARLGSDADYCGLGEAYAADGLFRDVDHAYYVGCGTGIADALKLRGKLVPFDHVREWLQKSWQLQSSVGPTFEKLISARAMNDTYARLLGSGNSEPPRFPEVDALAGNTLAVTWLDMVTALVAELIVERVTTIRNGRCSRSDRGESYSALAVDHPYRGILLDRVIVGQRLGLLCADDRYRPLVRDRLEAHLVQSIRESGDDELAGRLIDGAALRPGFLMASHLRAAPALGAAVAAARAFTGDEA